MTTFPTVNTFNSVHPYSKELFTDDESLHAMDISQCTKNISSLKLDLAKYYTLADKARIVKNIGIALTISGIAIAILPISVPALVGLTTTMVLIHDYPEFILEALSGTFAGIVTLKFTWKPLTAFAYSSEITTIAGIACGVITGIGGIAIGVGMLSERHYNTKLLDLYKQLHHNQDKLKALNDDGTEMHVFNRE